jgi:PAS domain S-box-containing protein
MKCGILQIKNAPTIIRLFKELVKRRELPDTEGDDRNVTQLALRHKKGHTVFIEASTTAIKTDGKLEGFLSVIRDITERKRAEHALKESEEMYREIVELAPDGIVTVDLKGMVTSCNTPFLQRTGYSKDEFVGKHISRIPTARLKDIPKYLKIFGSMLRGKVPEPFEFIWIHKNGTEHWGEVRVSVIKRNGRMVSFQAITRNITERKKAEEALKASELRFRSLIEHTTDAVFCYEYDPPIPTDLPIAEQVKLLYDAVLVECNDVCARSYGARRAQEVIGRTLTELFGTSPGSLDKLFTSLIQGGYHIVDGQGVEKLEDGTQRYYLNNGHGVIENGKLVLVWGNFRDITERKKAEETLREREEQFRQFFENQPEYCYMVSVEGVILDVNIATLKALGYRKEELIGKHLKTIYAPESRTKVEQLFTKWKKTGRLRDKEFVIISKTGEKRTVLLSADAVRDKDGKILHSVSIQRDITERKRAEEILQQTTKELQVILDSVPAGIWYKDTENRLLRVNKAGAESIGMKVEDIEGRAVSDIFPEDAEHYYEDDLEVIKSGKPKLGIVERMQAPGGENKWVQTDKVPYRDEQGSVAGVIAFVQDITERKKAEEEVLAERNKLQAMLGAMECGVTIRDLDYTLTYQNDYVTNIYGNHVGEKCYCVFQNLDKVCDGCPVELAFKDGKAHTSVRRVVLSSGEVTFWENTASPIRDASENIISCLENIGKLLRVLRT